MRKKKQEKMFGVDIQWSTSCCPPTLSLLAVVIDSPLAFAQAKISASRSDSLVPGLKLEHIVPSLNGQH